MLWRKYLAHLLFYLTRNKNKRKKQKLMALLLLLYSCVVKLWIWRHIAHRTQIVACNRTICCNTLFRWYIFGLQKGRKKERKWMRECCCDVVKTEQWRYPSKYIIHIYVCIYKYKYSLRIMSCWIYVFVRLSSYIWKLSI